MNSFIKLFWKHELKEEPVLLLYEINRNRFIIRAIELFADGTIQKINNFYQTAIEVVPIPPVQQFNCGSLGKEFYAFVISQQEFEEIWTF